VQTIVYKADIGLSPLGAEIKNFRTKLRALKEGRFSGAEIRCIYVRLRHVGADVPSAA
jgi:hypothetical protein